MDQYVKTDNPLFIRTTHSYARQVYVVGHYHGSGYSPFAFEDMGQPFSSCKLSLGMDNRSMLNNLRYRGVSWYSNTLNDMMPL